jgi:hypothetical protein
MGVKPFLNIIYGDKTKIPLQTKKLFFLIYLSQWQRKLLYRLIHSQLLGTFSYSVTINNVKIIYNSGVYSRYILR